MRAGDAAEDPGGTCRAEAPGLTLVAERRRGLCALVAIPVVAHGAALVTAAPLASTLGVSAGLSFLVGCVLTWWWTASERSKATSSALVAFEEELTTLRQDNARLRVERERGVSAGAAGARLGKAATVVHDLRVDLRDDPWAMEAATAAKQTALRSMCEDMQMALGHMLAGLGGTQARPDLEIVAELDAGRDAERDTERDTELVAEAEAG